MSVSMNQSEREAVAAMQAAAQTLAKALELAERADYGTQIMLSRSIRHTAASVETD